MLLFPVFVDDSFEWTSM